LLNFSGATKDNRLRYPARAVPYALGLLLAANFSLPSFAADFIPATQTQNGVPKTVNASTMPGSKPRVCLVLGGGGTRGFAHIGVLRVLLHAGIPVDEVVATSIGSVIGGLYCAGLTPDRIETVLRDRAFYDSFEAVPTKIGMAMLPISVVPRAITHKSYAGLYSGNKFANYLASQIPAEKQAIEKLDIPFHPIAFDLLDARARAIDGGDLTRAIQASCAIPELRQPVAWQGHLFVDGAVVANLPCEQARTLAPSVLIAVNVDETMNSVTDASFKALGSVTDRCVSANLLKIDEDQEKAADIVIKPAVTGIKLLSRNQNDMQRAIRAGEAAAEAAIPAIKARLQEAGCVVLNK
jgi:NTE family protein